MKNSEMPNVVKFHGAYYVEKGNEQQLWVFFFFYHNVFFKFVMDYMAGGSLTVFVLFFFLFICFVYFSNY
jgi:hypothetical protein